MHIKRISQLKPVF